MNTLELIATGMFFVGIIGMSVIIFRKIPVLNSLSVEPPPKPSQRKIKKRRNPFYDFSPKELLKKPILKIKILSSKTKDRTVEWEKKIWKKSLEKKGKFSEDYWQKIKRKKS